MLPLVQLVSRQMFTLPMELHGNVSKAKQFCWVNTPAITGESFQVRYCSPPLAIHRVSPGRSQEAVREVLPLLLSALFANTGVQTIQHFTQTLNQQL